MILIEELTPRTRGVVEFLDLSRFPSPSPSAAPQLAMEVYNCPLPRSIKNLDMCTENLGCETGVAYDDMPCKAGDQDLEAATMSDKRETIPHERLSSQRVVDRKRAASQFPPPLTILSVEARRKVVSKRENGRLLLFSVRPSLIEARREDGSLKLRLYSGEEPLVDGRDRSERKATAVRGGYCKEEEGGSGGGGCLRRNSDAMRLLQIDADAPLVASA
ncbi:hypothetical protein Cni_G20771 [Canna indica]|uniref:FAF domain-containing protein n=1 Tax=Canna indica TaxID=4628 RepID=A0AAQ3KQI6_9LILI|nr:hypothetical protein Cni_G20771 [Canna indica]